MKCPRCQHENPSAVKFCGECGARLELLCPSCRAANPPANKFCNECGESLAQPASAPKFASPQIYTPKHLAEKILTSKSALEGERKQVTVLFADMKGSMELLADRDPEEARKILDPVLQYMMESVHRYEGTVNQVMGDGIMALFGAPLAHEDHAVRACYAAIKMQESVKRYAEGVRRTEGVPIQIRVGLNSGEVVVRSIGSDLKIDYTAVGQTTHLAARIEQMATADSILITPETLGLAEGYVQVKSLGPVNVKGMNEPMEVHEITGAGWARSRLQAAAARGLTRFVGRDAETEQLRKALEQAQAGHGQVVAVVGEPGVGKSRLFYEFTHSYRTQDWLVLESGSVSYGKATAYLPVIDLLKSYFHIETRDAIQQVREKVTGKILTLDERLKNTISPILSLLEALPEDDLFRSLDPPQRRIRILDGLKQLFLSESQRQPLLLVFEDLHWIDSETQASLDNLLESLPTARLLLLASYRPEYQHGWGNKTYYTQLRIDPLPADSAEELLNSLLGNSSELQSLKRLLIERTEGNPFFLEESVRNLVETRVLMGERGNYHLEKKVESTQAPATVQAVLAARIDRLPLEEKQLLQSAAVIGKDVPFPLLQAITELSDEELRRGLTHLQAAEFLYETSLFLDLEYTFKHALTHEVAYGSLLRERQRALHARIVEAIETLYSNRLIEQAERLAHHALRGELWEKAVAYLRQAGLRAVTRSANREAVAYLEQALEAFRHLPENPELAIDLRLDLRAALFPLADFARMQDYLQEAEALARSLGDQRRLGQIATNMAVQHINAGDYSEALSFGREALAIGEALGDHFIEVRATSQLGAAHNARGEFREAARLLERNAARLEGDERVGRVSFLSAAFSRAYLADALSELGRFDEAIAYAEAAVRLGEAANDPYVLHFGLFDLGLTHLRRGDATHATRILERCLDVCRTSRIVVAIPIAAAALGAASALVDRLDAALPLVEESVEEFHARPLYRRPGLILVLAGMTYLRAGRIDEAVGCAGEALALTRRLGARGSAAHALSLSGEIASQLGSGDAEGYDREALALAGDLGMRPLVAHCHLGLGKLYRRTGKQEQAKQHLISATIMMREMEMGLWLEKAEAELKGLDDAVPKV